MATATAVKPSLTIKRRLKAPPAKVFAAWTDPEKLTRWFRPGDVFDVEATLDPRTGGSYQIIGKSPGDTHHVSGTYREVVPNERLVFTWAWKSTPERQSLVTITLKPDGEGTLLTLTHEQFFDEAARDRHQYGWNSALDKLDTFVA